MNPAARLGNALRRIATIASITRTRQEDATRERMRGGPRVVAQSREEAAVSRLEARATDMGKAL